ncbi:MAG: Heterodimeric efflux ABC transporter, permease/ATP-binding subunit 2, partial [uncultured Thermomicrobiales bacterium]
AERRPRRPPRQSLRPADRAAAGRLRPTLPRAGADGAVPDRRRYRGRSPAAEALQPRHRRSDGAAPSGDTEPARGRLRGRPRGPLSGELGRALSGRLARQPGRLRPAEPDVPPPPDPERRLRRPPRGGVDHEPHPERCRGDQRILRRGAERRLLQCPDPGRHRRSDAVDQLAAGAAGVPRPAVHDPLHAGVASPRDWDLPGHQAGGLGRQRRPRRKHCRGPGRPGVRPRAGQHPPLRWPEPGHPGRLGRCRQTLLAALPGRLPDRRRGDRAGGGRRRPARLRPEPDDRRVGPLRRPDRPLLRADPRPQPAVQRAPGGDGRRRTRLRGARRRARGARQAGCPRPAADRWPGRLRRRPLRLRRDRDPAWNRPPRRPRRDGRVRRRDGGRQDLDGQPPAPLLRRLVGPGRGRRPRRPRRHPGVTPLAARHRPPGHLPLRRQRPRQHRLRPPRGYGRGGRAGGAGGGGAHLHRRAAGPLRDGDPGAGGKPLGRPAATAGVRPGAPGRPPDPDPGRGDLQRRHPDRAPDPGGAAPPPPGADVVRDRPPPLDHTRGRHCGRDAPGPDRRAGQPRRAGGPRWLLPPALRGAVGGGVGGGL